MVLKLHGFVMSTCTKRVAVVLHEKQVPFEFVPVDPVKSEHKSEKFLALQPFGQAPVLEDDGYILYESRAMARYIAEKYAGQGTQLIPADLKSRGLFEQAASIESSNFNEYAEPAVAEMIFKKMRGGTPDEARFKDLISKLSAKLDVYDKILSKQKYLGGNEVTLADLFHLPYATMLSVAGSDIMTQKPNVARWFKDLESRPAWQAVKDGVKSTSSY